MRRLHGALVILVRLQISQFRSLGKWACTLCLPKSSRLFVVGSKEASWEELAWEPPCNGISSSTKFSLNSCSHSGISESSHGFPHFIGVSFLFGFGVLLAWVSSGFPDLSSTNSDTGTAIWSSWRFGNDSPIRSLIDSSASRIHASLVFNFVRSATPTILHNFTGHSRSNWCFQLLTYVLDGFLKFLILWVDEINSSQFSCVIKMNLFFSPLLLLLQLGILSHWLP